jgi:hypothetical protein
METTLYLVSGMHLIAQMLIPSSLLYMLSRQIREEQKSAWEQLKNYPKYSQPVTANISSTRHCLGDTAGKFQSSWYQPEDEASTEMQSMGT